MYLQKSFTRESDIRLICNLNISLGHKTETLDTLRFSSRIKNINLDFTKVTKTLTPNIEIENVSDNNLIMLN